MVQSLKIIVYFFFLLCLSTSCRKELKDKQNGVILNRLATASSPYLLQHADNPVHWYEWGPEALKKAKEENKPLIISIGYSSCHWCHVMERETFMDSAVAKIMNENFISLKIDREERPDIDQIYINAAQLITGGGGWPLNAFALPDGRPFHVVTYSSKEQWIGLLQKMSATYNSENEKLVDYAESLTQGIRMQEVIKTPADTSLYFNKTIFKEMFEHWEPLLDFDLGGFIGEPKFPLPISGNFLLQYYFLTGNEKALEAATITLDEIALGGIYDQLGGGFARYSMDKNWKVPHFEKMLYDNGQLVSLYANAYKLTKKPLYGEVVRNTLSFIENVMTSPQGGFYSSVNAESEGEEGKFYVWDKDEIEKILDKRTSGFIYDYYQIINDGNWEDRKNILHVSRDYENFASKHGLKVNEWNEMLANAKLKLLNARNKRVRPSTDNRILTSWNALMLMGYTDAFLALGNETYLNVALKNARFLEENLMSENGSLYRSHHKGKPEIEAFLDDYALLAKAYIQLYQATFDVHWLELARTLADYAIVHFQDESSSLFYYTSDQSNQLVARKMQLYDNVIPASNSVMADVLFHLGEYLNEPKYIGISKTMLNQVAQEVSTNGPYYANWARLMGLITYEPYEVAIMGEEALRKNHFMQKQYVPLAIYMGGQKENLPLLENKLSKGKTLIYICQNKTCLFPLEDVDKALQHLTKKKHLIN